MSLKELKEAVNDVVSGRAKMSEVAYGDDGVDMARDILAVIQDAEEWKRKAAQHGCNVEDGDPDCG